MIDVVIEAIELNRDVGKRLADFTSPRPRSVPKRTDSMRPEIEDLSCNAKHSRS